MAESEIATQLERRRRVVAERWNLGAEVVVIGAGEPVAIPGRGDRTYPFRAHSEYFYLTDRERPGGVLAYDPEDGWIDFVRPVSREEMLWEGARPGADAGAHTGAASGVPLGGLEGWLARRETCPLANLGAAVSGVGPGPEALTAELRRGLNYVRRQKDAVELERMRAAARATAAGFAAIVPALTTGRTERDVQIELEAEFFRNGADCLAFDTIVAAGPNSAVLHFPPSAKPLRDGELVLIDAGGEVRGYASDVTRTYPVSGSLTPEQAAVHGMVERAGEAATAQVAAGVEFRHLHRTAAHVIAEGLVDLGVLRGEPEALIESGAVTLFFPHGVGHMVGLGVRDAGEVLPGRKPDAGLPALRADLPLLPGHVVTIEPGVYFVPALLGDPETRARLCDQVDWERADGMVGFGGIRIENNVLATEEGHEVLTGDIPILG